MPRLAPLDPATLDADARRVHDIIVAGPRGAVQGPLRVWLESPALAERAQALGEFCRFGSSLAPRLSELAIITVGAFWRAGFEWWAHAPLAEQAGIVPDAIAAIKEGNDPVLAREDERVVHRFTQELLTTKRVSAATYEAAAGVLGTRGVVDLVGIVGYYGLISLTINAFEVAVPAPHAEPFG